MSGRWTLRSAELSSESGEASETNVFVVLVSSHVESFTSFDFVNANLNFKPAQTKSDYTFHNYFVSKKEVIKEI
jgi:hypothetical protein